MLADTINIGIIGVGGRGADHLRNFLSMAEDPGGVRVHSLCDIYEPRKERARKLAGLDRCFHDYREMLAQSDLDGVVIATPDHWHARMSIDAMLAGKDVYCEKPMTRYWDEAKEVARVQAKTGRVFQVGVQSTSDDINWQARRLIDAGLIGKLIHIQDSANRNVPGGDWNYSIDRNVSLKNLDWKRFLGPAPPRPFNEETIERYFRFRKFWDYSGGLATDLLYHRLGAFSVAMGARFPLRVRAVGGNYVHFDREVPDTFTMSVDMEGDCTLTLFATAGNDAQIHREIRGTKGTLRFIRDRSKDHSARKQTLVVRSQKVHAGDARERAVAVMGSENIQVSSDFMTIEVSPMPRLEHRAKFLECMRDRAPTPMGADEGYRVMTSIALAVRAYRQSEAVDFDPRNQKLVLA